MTPGTRFSTPFAAAALSALFAGSLSGVATSVGAQIAPGRPVAAEAALTLRRLDGVKRVLMIAAHPDDEDSSLLAALSRGWGVETAYLSLTRGDGGQNLIGPELGEGLGVLRTGELEAARTLDGAAQFFTRAYDFGYTKSADETLRFWAGDEVLADAVWVIRRFRPHVIVSQWSGTPRDGHGQHQAAGIVARQAFEAAGDPARFPEQLEAGFEAWAPLKLYVGFRRSPGDATLEVATGTLDPLLGRSWFQLGMDSRSQHRSQDMGVRQHPGPRASRLDLVDGPTGADGGLFAGVDTSLTGLADLVQGSARAEVRQRLEAYRATLGPARAHLSAAAPWEASPYFADALAQLRAAARAVPDLDAAIELSTVLARRTQRVEEALLATAVVSLDAYVSDDLVVPGESITIHVELWNGGPFTVRGAEPALALPADWDVRWAADEELELPGRGGFFAVPATGVQLEGPGGVDPGELARWSFRVSVPTDAPLTRQYYLAEPRNGAMYRWPADRTLWASPRNPPLIRATVRGSLEGPGIGSVDVASASAATYLGVDPARGEFRTPVHVVPAVSVALDPAGMVWPAGYTDARDVTVVVANEAAGGTTGLVRLRAPDGWSAEPRERSFSLEAPGSRRSFTFRLRPVGPVPPGEHTLAAVVVAADGSRFTEGVTAVDYPHIDRVVRFHPARARVSSFPVRVAPGLRVGYVMGTGDGGPTALRELGVQVEELSPDAVRSGDFSRFDAIVLGVRAYEARPDLAATNAQLLDYVREGGTVVSQYNQFPYTEGGFAPYPIEVSRDRVSVEDAPVTLLDPEAPVLTEPNRITREDFEGWVQERGLYFPDAWDARWQPVIATADPGEEEKRGSILVASVGDGVYVYTSLSFFRQFPAGVPGAYRLFANMVSLTADRWNDHVVQPGGPR